MLLVLEEYLSVEQLALTYIQTDFSRWWSDVSLGSKLWELANAKTGDEFLSGFEKIVLDSLTPLKDDGLAKSIEIKSEFVSKTRVNYQLTITRPDETSEVINASWGV